MDTLARPPAAIREEAEAAERSEKWAEASAHWRSLKEALPDQPIGYLREARSLGRLGQHLEAESLLSEALKRFADHRDINAEYAMSADARGEYTTAVTRWRTACERFPDWGGIYSRLAASLNNAGKYEEADEFLRQAVERFPDRYDIIAECARTLTLQGRWAEAAARWKVALDAFPNEPAAYVGFAQALHRVEGHESAYAVIKQGLEAFPTHFELMCEDARNLNSADRIDESLERWKFIRKAFPKRLAGYVEPAEIMRNKLRFDECMRIVEVGLEYFPSSTRLLSEPAKIATARKDWETALRCWHQVLRHAPKNRAALFGCAEAYIALNRPAEAIEPLEAILMEAPTHARAIAMRARTEIAERSWLGAISRLTKASRLLPGDKSITALLYEARMGALLESKGRDERTSSNTEIEMPQAIAIAATQATPENAFETQALMNRFESVGDNCEFGLVQRFFGAEPIGLLRWTAISAKELVGALQANLSGVGDLENTSLSVSGCEYVTRDRNYRMTMHTFIRCDTIEPEALLPQIIRRQKFLVRKFLEDLERGTKIFVFKSMTGVNDSEIALLLDALAQFGDNRLLCVREADSQHPPGTVDAAMANLCIGYIARFGHHGGNWNIDFDGWLNICQKALLSFDASSGQSFASANSV